MGNHKNGSNRTIVIELTVDEWCIVDTEIRLYISHLQGDNYDPKNRKHLNHLANIRNRIIDAVNKNEHRIKLTLKMYTNILAFISLNLGKNSLYLKLKAQEVK
jgi:hypothetical protein